MTEGQAGDIVITFTQFRARVKSRHDFSDQIQVRYTDPAGESVDTWVSGEEVIARLQTAAREKLVRSFAVRDWQQIRDDADQMLDQGRQKAFQALRDRLAQAMARGLGNNIFSETLADSIRGSALADDPYQAEKAAWQAMLQESGFRDGVLELAWIQLKDALPETAADEIDDWI